MTAYSDDRTAMSCQNVQQPFYQKLIFLPEKVDFAAIDVCREMITDANNFLIFLYVIWKRIRIVDL